MFVKKYSVLIFALLSLCFTSACEQGRQSGKGLHLPEGNMENGKTAFIELECHQCHSVAGVELPAHELETAVLSLNLGGKVFRVKTYGELVTSITNPQHIISPQYLKMLEKPVKVNDIVIQMPSYNDEMTVTQLIDVVTFLDSHYQKLQPNYSGYHYMVPAN